MKLDNTENPSKAYDLKFKSLSKAFESSKVFYSRVFFRSKLKYLEYLLHDFKVFLLTDAFHHTYMSESFSKVSKIHLKNFVNFFCGTQGLYKKSFHTLRKFSLKYKSSSCLIIAVTNNSI